MSTPCNGSVRRPGRMFGLFLLVGLMSALALAVAATAGTGAGLVAAGLGSPDPREGVGSSASAGLVATELGTPDARDTTGASVDAGLVATRLGSADPVDTAFGATNVTPYASPSGFDWGDFAIGVGAGIGILILLAGAVGALRASQHFPHWHVPHGLGRT